MFAQSSSSKISAAFTTPSKKMTPLQEELFNMELDFSKVTAEVINQYVDKIKQLYKETYDGIAALASNPKYINFNTVMQPLIDLEVFADKAYNFCTFPMQMHTDPDVREASQKADDALKEMNIECEQREDTFAVIQNYHSGLKFLIDKSDLHQEKNRFIEKLMLQYKRNGLYIADPQKKLEITKIKKEIELLANQFGTNLREEKTTLEFSKEQLNGLPEKWLQEKNPKNNKYIVTLKNPDYNPVMEFCTDRNTRKEMYAAYQTRCEKENLPILKQVIGLRQQLAQLLGYKTHADYIAETRLIKTAKTGQEFIDGMNERFTPLLEQNLNALTEFARSKEKDSNFILKQWDMPYYLRLREEAVCNIDMLKIKEYFPLEKVISGTFDIYKDLFGLEFVKKANGDTWHKECLKYEVYDKASKAIMGTFVIDLHPRQGKYAHAAVFSLCKGSDVSHLTGIPVDRRTAVVGMLCNFDKSTLKFDEVKTFFHEFGHIMHFICSKTKLAQMNSADENHLERDFVEAPSQMLENWVYEPAALAKLSAHVETGEPLPSEIAANIRDKRKLHIGYEQKRQLMFGNFDYMIHSMSADEIAKLDIKKFWQEHQSWIMKLPFDSTGCFAAAFGHLMHGYDAAYYGYMYSATWAAHMFKERFAQNPMSCDTGMDYRKTILKPGGSRDAIDYVTEFSGKEPNLDAFLEQCGFENSPKIGHRVDESKMEDRPLPVPPMVRR